MPHTMPAARARQQNRRTNCCRLVCMLCLAVMALPAQAQINEAKLLPEKREHKVANTFGIDQIVASFQEVGDAIVVDFSNCPRLQADTKIDPASIVGEIHIGPYPFLAKELDYAAKAFAKDAKLVAGRAELPLAKLLSDTSNSEGWETHGQVVVRLNLYGREDGAAQVQHLGLYETFLAFAIGETVVDDKPQPTFQILPTMVEGPMINVLYSGSDPIISFVTAHGGQTATVVVTGRDPIVSTGTSFAETDVYSEPDDRWLDKDRWFRHEVTIPGLSPGTTYQYAVQLGGVTSKWYRFKTAPPAGRDEPCRFVFIGDSRPGEAGGMENMMAVNQSAMQRLARLAYNKGADLLLMGGDLCQGYTTGKRDFHTQMYSWKQSVAGFAAERPVYATMGNHELFGFSYEDDSTAFGLMVDRWPYDTNSTEAIFAHEFVNPESDLQPERPGLPSYQDTAYAFSHGSVRFIAFNTNYWAYSEIRKIDHVANPRVSEFGGNPEGYVMPNQLAWIRRELTNAQNDHAVRHIILFAHEPMFPNGKHLADAMWYEGENTMRAHYVDGSDSTPAGPGILDVRDELAEMIAQHDKVAAVIASDEHAYYRTLIGPEVPIGGTGETNLAHRTWYLVCGGGGAPYSLAKTSLWNQYWLKHGKPNQGVGYKYSPQEHLLLFEADGRGISMQAINVHGETIDYIADLRAAKDISQPPLPPAGPAPDRPFSGNGPLAASTMAPRGAIESWIVTKLTAGEIADLSSEFPDLQDRVLEARFLEQLLTGAIPHRHGIRIKGAIVNQPLDLENAHIKQNVELLDCDFRGTLRGFHATFADNVSFQDSQFRETDLRASLFKKDFVLEGARFHEGLRMSRADIGGSLDADRIVFPNSNKACTLYHTTVGKGAYFARGHFANHVNFRDARFGSDLDLTLATFQSTVDLRHAKIGGTFYLHGNPLNIKQDSVSVRGLTYHYVTNAAQTRSDIALAEKEGRNPDEDAMALIETFIQRTKYSADAYSALEQYFQDQGNRQAANSVYINGKWRELRTTSWQADAKNLFLWLTVGYGRRPWLAFAWSLLFIGLGCWVFRPSRDRMELKKPHDEWQGEHYSLTWCFWYSLDLFVPAVNLCATDVWKTRLATPWWVRNYARLHTILGWILIPIGIAAVMGIIKA